MLKNEKTKIILAKIWNRSADVVSLQWHSGEEFPGTAEPAGRSQELIIQTSWKPNVSTIQIGSETTARSSMNKGIWTAGSNDLDIQLACTGGARCINLECKTHLLGVQEHSSTTAKGKPHPSPPHRGREHLPGQGEATPQSSPKGEGASAGTRQRANADGYGSCSASNSGCFPRFF